MSEPEKVDIPAAEQPQHLGFMYGKISVKPAVMYIWLNYPDFVREIETLISKGITIDNQSVYEVIKGIYFPLRRERELYGLDKNKDGALNHSKTRKGLRDLCTVLYGNPDKWEADYEAFVSQV